MTTVFVVGDRKDWRVSLAVDTLRAAGMRVVDAAGHPPGTVDAACIFWDHTARWDPTYESNCRAALDGIHRRVLINADGSQLPSYLSSIRAVIHGPPSGGFEIGSTDHAAWRRVVTSIVPDLQFDTRNIRAAVEDAAFVFRLWLATSRDPAPDLWPDWSSIRESFSAILTLVLYVAGVATLASLFPDRSRLLLAAVYTAALPIVGLVIGPYLIDVIERTLGLSWEFESTWPWTVIAATPLAVLCGFRLLAGHSLISPAIQTVIATIVLTVAMVVLAVAFNLAGRVVYWSAMRLPAESRACYLSYPPALTALAGLLQSELSGQGIEFFDGCTIRHSDRRGESARVSRRRIKKALRSSGMLVTLVSADHLSSSLTQCERRIATSLQRPVLDIHVSMPPATSDAAAWHTISLAAYVQRALGAILHPVLTIGRADVSMALSRELLNDFKTFVSGICRDCHGHGTDVRYATRLVPHALRIRCHRCSGTSRFR
jgi:hypothetical protein